MLASFLQISSYNKLTQQNISLFNLTQANTGSYYVSCRDKYQVVSSQYQANIFYQVDDNTLTNSTVSNPGKYHIQDDHVIIEGDINQITFADLQLDQSKNVTLSHINVDTLSKGCQFFTYNNTTYAIWQSQDSIQAYNYETRQKQTLLNITNEDDIELLTLRSQCDANYIVIRQGKLLYTYNLTTVDTQLQLQELNSFNLIDLYQFFNVQDNYVNVSTMLQYSRVTLFLDDYLVVQSQYQLLYHYIVFLRLSDMVVQCFNTPTTTAFYFTSNGIQGLYGVGVFEDTTSNLASYDLTGILDAQDNKDYAPNNCWLIKPCVTAELENKSVTLTLNDQSTDQQCQTCDQTPLLLYYKDYYQTLQLQYINNSDNTSYYYVAYNTSFPQICYEIYSDEYIMEENGKLIGSYSIIFDTGIQSCYAIPGYYNLEVNNNFVTYYSSNQKYSSTCMNDDPDISVKFNQNSANSKISLPQQLVLQPKSLQLPTSPVDYEGYLSVNLHDVIEKDCPADIYITSYSPNGYIYKTSKISNITASVTVDNCYIGDDYMLAEYQPGKQRFVLRPTYKLTRYDHPCSLDTTDVQNFVFQANIDGYITDIDQDSFTVDSDGFYIHEFYINPNVDRIQTAILSTTYKNKQYTPDVKHYQIPLSCMFIEDSFRFKNENDYLVLMWMNSSKCNMKNLPAYDSIIVTVDGYEYEFDDYSNDGLEYYIEYDLDKVDQIDFYISIGAKDICIKSYYNLSVLDFSTHSQDDWQIPFAVYCSVFGVFYIVIAIVYFKVRPQNNYEKIQNNEETTQQEEKAKQKQQKEDKGIFEESQSNSNKQQDQDDGDIENGFSSQENSDSELYYGIPKPKYK